MVGKVAWKASAKMTSALIVDDEPGIRSFLHRGLRKHFDLVEVAGDVKTAEDLRKRCHFDLIITDTRLPGRTGIEWITELREQDWSTGVIFITAHADLETAIAALRNGAEDFILKPFRLEQMIAAVEHYQQRHLTQHENSTMSRQIEHIYDCSGLVGNCGQIKNICEVIKRVAPMPSTVLIDGESGTGKELAVRAIHERSGRSGNFVAINCGGMSAELLESELFGHVKGAFTGAHQAREGLFTYADNGTMFLDEIGEMPLAMQAHLLRSLEEHSIRPVGSNREIPVDVRIIAATNCDLGIEVSNGKFREDLYYRLNVLSIRMPPLRERIEDIPLLATHFLDTISTELGVVPPHVGETEISSLCNYNWPGNVRELKNVIERCLLLSRAPSECMMGLNGERRQVESSAQADDSRLESVEKRHILQVLEQEGGNKSAAARLLGISRKTIERKTHAWDIG